MKDNKIKKVVLYNIERNGTKVVESAIWKGDNIQIKDKAAGIDALHKLAKEKGYTSVEDLKNDGYFIVVDEEQLKEKYPALYKLVINKDIENKKEENIDNLDDSFLEETKESELKMVLIKSAIYLTAGIFTIVGSSKIIKNAFDDNNIKTTIESTEDNIDPEDDIERVINVQNYETAEEMLDKYGSLSELLVNSNINSTKKEVLSNIWNYISDYNISVAKNHSSSTSDKKLAHSWDEVMVSYLAYNDISLEEACNIFDYYNIPIDLFKEEYQVGFNQDVLAYTILKTNTNKADLIISEEGKEFYKEYENLIIKYNKTVSKDPKEEKIPELINKFYNKVRNDFDINTSTDNVEDYKLSVIPIINAFDGMLVNYNCEGKLNEEEKAYFAELSKFDKIEDKISTLSNSLATINTTEKFASEFTDEYTYSQINDAAISELELYSAYNIDETDRNISEYSEYKSMFITFTEEQEENTKTEINKTNKTNNKKYSDYDDAGMVEDEEEDEKIPDWMIEDNDQSDIIDETKEETTEEIYDVDDDTPAVTEDEDSSDYDDSIKDVTPDETNSDDNSLPDPNKSSISYNGIKGIIADRIIEMMCESSNTNEHVVKYTKKHNIFKNGFCQDIVTKKYKAK